MFNHDIVQDFKKHAMNEYPKEACGLILRDRYLPCRNLADNPEIDFAVDPKVYLDHHGDVLGVLHSHTNKNPHVTEADMRGQIRSKLPWGFALASAESCTDPIWFGDQAEKSPLVGRKFISGVWDCYSLIRDFYIQEFGITLMEVPRDHNWWKKGRNLYSELWPKAGFTQIEASEARHGDCFLMQVGSRVPNHAGIYLGNGLGLNHFEHQLSRRESLNPYANRIVVWARYKDFME